MRRPAHGLTLIEGLLAALVLACAAVGLLEALRVGVKQTERVEGEVLAVALAQETMDVVASLPYSRLSEAARAGSGPKPLSPAALAALASDPDLAPVRRRLARLADTARQEVVVTLAPVAGPAGTGRLVEVTVEARFESELAPGKPVTRRVVLRRFVTDDEEVDA